jgi:hypothetical protein
MSSIKMTSGNVISHFWDKLFVALWHVELFAFGTQCIEKTVELSPTYKANVANFYGAIRYLWSWIP